MRRFVVTGPPDSGKTTYVKSHKADNAVVWDADDIVRVMCGAERHQWPIYMRTIIAAMLAGFVASVQRCPTIPEVWIIITDTTQAEQVAARINGRIVRCAADVMG